MLKCALISIYKSFDIAPNILYTILFIVYRLLYLYGCISGRVVRRVEMQSAYCSSTSDRGPSFADHGHRVNCSAAHLTDHAAGYNPARRPDCAAGNGSDVTTSSRGDACRSPSSSSGRLHAQRYAKFFKSIVWDTFPKESSLIVEVGYS